jgi:hypothetical protein
MEMRQCQKKLNMYETAVFAIRIQGEIGEDWAEYVGAQKMATEKNEAGFPVTTLTTEPVDQAGLISMINHVNMLALPLISVECLPAEGTQPGVSDKYGQKGENTLDYPPAGSPAPGRTEEGGEG